MPGRDEIKEGIITTPVAADEFASSDPKVDDFSQPTRYNTPPHHPSDIDPLAGWTPGFESEGYNQRTPQVNAGYMLGLNAGSIGPENQVAIPGGVDPTDPDALGEALRPEFYQPMPEYRPGEMGGINVSPQGRDVGYHPKKDPVKDNRTGDHDQLTQDTVRMLRAASAMEDNTMTAMDKIEQMRKDTVAKADKSTGRGA